MANSVKNDHTPSSKRRDLSGHPKRQTRRKSDEKFYARIPIESSRWDQLKIIAGQEGMARTDLVATVLNHYIDERLLEKSYPELIDALNVVVRRVDENTKLVQRNLRLQQATLDYLRVMLGDGVDELE